MNNAARHVLGLVVGVVAAPVTLLLWCWGFTNMFANGSLDAFDASPPGLMALAAGGAILGVLCGSRVSPLGSLLSALFFLGIGGLWAADPDFAYEHVLDPLPRDFRSGALTLTTTGLSLTIGVLLLVASIPVSRWQVLRKPPPAPYPQLPFADSPPGLPAPGLPGNPVAGAPSPAVPLKGDAPHAPPIPYDPGT